jgi:hypothetical protein
VGRGAGVGGASGSIIVAFVIKLIPGYAARIQLLPLSLYSSWLTPMLSSGVGLNAFFAVSIPETTLPNGANPMESRRELSI